MGVGKINIISLRKAPKITGEQGFERGGFRWVLGGARNRNPIHNSFGPLWSSLCASSGSVLVWGCVIRVLRSENRLKI